MKMVQCLLGSLLVSTSFAWNALGHRVVAEIAYQNLSDKSRVLFNRMNHALDEDYPPLSFSNAAVWLDSIKARGDHRFDALHYYDKPFSRDGTPLVPLPKPNAVVAIESTLAQLSDPSLSLPEQGVALRILLHVVGDLHQPLHAATEISYRHPKGDHGGNSLPLKNNTVASNLHQYWDKGGGLLLYQDQKKLAAQIESKWPCQRMALDNQSEKWAMESHELAIHHAYRLEDGQRLSRTYQQRTQELTELQLARAGCRLAFVLNQTQSKTK